MLRLPRNALGAGPLIMALLMGLHASARAQSLQETFEEGNAAYFRGELDEAATAYRALLELGVHDPDVAYNLATTEARRGRFGEAIRFFERALYLRPGDGAALDGLSAARAALARRRAREGEREVEFAPPLAEGLFGGWSSGVLFVSTTLANLLFFGLLGALVCLRRTRWRPALAMASAVAGMVFIGAGLSLAVKEGWSVEGEAAVVVAPRSTVREGPHPRADVRGQLAEGVRVQIIDRHERFARVQGSEGADGWVAEDEVGTILPE